MNRQPMHTRPTARRMPQIVAPVASTTSGYSRSNGSADAFGPGPQLPSSESTVTWLQPSADAGSRRRIGGEESVPLRVGDDRDRILPEQPLSASTASVRRPRRHPRGRPRRRLRDGAGRHLAGPMLLLSGPARRLRTRSTPSRTSARSARRSATPSRAGRPSARQRPRHPPVPGRSRDRRDEAGRHPRDGDEPGLLNAAGTRLYYNETDRVGADKQGTVSAFAIDRKDGKLTLLNTVASGGRPDVRQLPSVRPASAGRQLLRRQRGRAAGAPRRPVIFHGPGQLQLPGLRRHRLRQQAHDRPLRRRRRPRASRRRDCGGLSPPGQASGGVVAVFRRWSAAGTPADEVGRPSAAGLIERGPSAITRPQSP